MPTGLRERKKRATMVALATAARRLTLDRGPDAVTVEDIENGMTSLETVNGATLNFGFDPSVSRVTINGGAASVEQSDIFASNGIVHVIDNVLLPPQ